MDGGDFSVGSLIQALYTTQAAELRTMGAMGYDAVTVGNHELTVLARGLARCSPPPPERGCDPGPASGQLPA